MKRYIRENRPGKRLLRKENTARDRAGKWLSGQRDRIIALLLVGAMGISLSSSLISYAVAAWTDPSLCDHHPAHTEACGYTEGASEAPCGHTHDETCGYAGAVDEIPCAHEHDGTCGYQAAEEGTPCAHVHDETCGYAEGTPEIPCDKGCTETDDEGGVIHADDCAYRPAEDGQDCAHVHDGECGYAAGVDEVPCAHVHDEACGYAAAVPAAPCTHAHDGDCGYAPAAEGTPCAFACPICHPEEYPMLDERVTILLPEEDEANLLAAGTEADLLDGVKLSAASGENGEDAEDLDTLAPDGYTLFVFSIVNRDGEPVNLGDGRYLIPEDGERYQIVYGACDRDGNLTAAAERAVTVRKQMNAVPLAGGDPYTVTTEDGSVKFTVTLPEETTFLSGDAEINATNPLTLKVQQYTEETESEDFDYNYHKDAIDQHMNWHTGVEDSTNDVQFWRIWFEDADENKVDVQLPANERATVVVTYLCPDGNTSGALKGDLGTRRTCVMDMGDPSEGLPETFAETDDSALETSHQPGDLVKEGDHYTKLTYYIDANENGDSAWGNLTALCAMKLTPAYMQSATIQNIADGSAPFDAKETNGDQPGNDSSAENKSVRTFDSVVYTLQFVSASRSATGQMDEYVAVVEAELKLDIAQARFDSTSLSSVFTGDAPWQIEYRDADGKNLYIENSSGIFKCKENGEITSTKVQLNNIISGSDDTNDDAYRSAVASQHLTAYRKITKQSGQVAVPSTQTATVQVNVTAAQNGDKVEPSFTCYVKGNKDNFTSEQNENNDYIVSEPSHANEIKTNNTENSVTVTAAARYNIVLKRNQDASYASYFNFSTGQESTAADGGTYGRMLGYGITLQLFNETNAIKDGQPDGSVLAAKGMRGIELPVNGISFDLDLDGNPGQDNDSTDDYSAILWDYSEAAPGTSEGKWDRNMYWAGQDAFRYPKGAGVFNSRSGTDSIHGVYDGGKWNMTASGDGVDSTTGKTTGVITDTGKDVKYSFTISGFDFDFDNFTSFPSRPTGTTADEDWLAPGYIGSFSGGYIEVLQKYPENPKADASPEITVTVSNMKAASKSNDSITEEATATTDKIGGLKDNTDRSNVAIYTPGNFSKHNSFGSRTNKNGNPNHGGLSVNFLGTDYWAGPSYDADTFAGSGIYLWGGAQLERKSDAVVSAYNLLQKFDGTVLSIDTSVENPVRYTDVNQDGNWPANGWANDKEASTLLPAAGDYKILYAADPLYPNGWDTNDKAQMARMNAATEADLVYFENLKELEDKGYTCTAVLLEVRNADIPAGCYPGVRIAVKVSDDAENIGKTIATVNTARMWLKPRGAAYNIFGGGADGSKADTAITWANGWLNSESKDNAATALNNGNKNKIQNGDGEDIYGSWWSPTAPNPHKVNGNTVYDDAEEVNAVNKMLAEKYGSSARYVRQAAHNNFKYHKTEYTEDSVKVEGTHEGYQQGMSLLVIGYESSVSVKVENTRTGKSSTDPDLSGNVAFETNYGEWDPLYTITGVRTTPSDPTGTGSKGETTNLTITAGVQNAAGKSQIAMGAAPFKVQTLKDGKMEWVEVSENSDEPTTVAFTGKDGKGYTYTIYAERRGNYEAVFHLSGVPVGEALPDIQYEGQLGADVEHTGNYTSQVSIQGDADKRALSSGNGNLAQVSVTTVVLAGTSLTKTVDTDLIEQNGQFTYGISYTNNADEPMNQKLYLYDLLPYNGDNRNTKYERDEDMTKKSDTLTVESVSGTVSGSSENTEVRVYYSTIIPTVLENYLRFAGGDDTTGADIDAMLRNALIGNDANGLWYVVEEGDENYTPVPIYKYEDEDNPDIVTGVNTDAVEYDRKDLYGEIKVKEGYLFYNPSLGITVGDGEQVSDDEDDGTVSLRCWKMFRWLGSISPSTRGNSLAAGETNLTYATCIYTVTEDLGAHSTLTVGATLKTEENEAANLYGNIANSWKQGDLRNGANLTSNLVTTRVVGREISGLVWEDLNQDGARQGTEPLISGVTCTLLKWDETKGEYEPVKGNGGPNGRLISVTEWNADEQKYVERKIGIEKPVQMTTGSNGQYRFSDLAAGDYVVAFSGDALTSYKAATDHQKKDVGASVNNDGVKTINGGTPAGLGDYAYYIKYQDGVAAGSNVKLYTVDELAANSSVLRNNTQYVENLDLGVIMDRYELPETGGRGTFIWTAGGLTLIWASISLAWIKRKKDQMWI